MYTSPAVIATPNWVWLDAAISCIRLLPASAMKTSPRASEATAPGLYRPASTAGPPSPVVRSVYPFPATPEMVAVDLVTFLSSLLPVSET